MSKGNPKAAVEAWLIATGQGRLHQQLQREGLKQKAKKHLFAGTDVKIDDTDVPRATMEPEAPVEQVQAPLLCFPLAAFIAHDPTLPSDFQSVERSGTGLKSHVRPDGAVFLGLYEVLGDKATGIVVFGPKETPHGVGIQVSQQYRQEQHALESGRRAAVEAQAQTSSPALIS